jgi:large conductance mechanosensitive channel
MAMGEGSGEKKLLPRFKCPRDLKNAWRDRTWCFNPWICVNPIIVMFKEFKEFALKGNLIDMAVAFVMGAAFVKLSTAFIEDLVMPFVGLISGGLDFSNQFIPLSSNVTKTDLAGARTQGAVFAYGDFITVAINFLIVAFAMFLVVKAINRAKKLAARAEAQAASPVLSTQEVLLTEIRDLLKQKS